jgi:hypothetical protein
MKKKQYVWTGGGYLMPKRVSRAIKRVMFWERLCKRLGLSWLLRKRYTFTHPITIYWEEDDTLTVYDEKP